MNIAEQARLYERSKRHWWLRGQQAIVEQVMLRWVRPASLVLDAGCGSGRIMSTLRRFGQTAIGVDREFYSLKLSGSGGLACGSITELPFASGMFDLVVCLDAIEHVKEDERALAEISRVLKPGGKLVLTVPAHQWLFSRHDVALGHHRRYSMRELCHKLEKAQFTLNYSTAFNTLLFPVAAIIRLFNRSKPSAPGPRAAVADIENVPPQPINFLLERLFRIERIWVGRVSCPIGLSLLCVASR